jgi:hypothetical protein
VRAQAPYESSAHGDGDSERKVRDLVLSCARHCVSSLIVYCAAIAIIEIPTRRHDERRRDRCGDGSQRQLQASTDDRARAE